MIIKKIGHSFLAILLIAFISQSNLFAQGSLNLSLLKASEKGDLNQVKELLDKGAEVNAKNKNGDTALRSAVVRGRKEIVKELLKRGADVNYKDSNGDTLLILAIQWGHKDIVKELLKRGVDVNAKYEFGETALMKAVQRKDKEIVKELLDKGAEVNAKNNFGETALRRSARYGYKDIEKILKLEEAIIEGEALDNINKLKTEDISWYLQRTLNQLDDGNTQIYNLLPNDYKVIVDVYRELMASNIDRDKIIERLENLAEYYPALKDSTKAHNLLKNNLAAIYNISNEYKIDIIPIATNIFLASGLSLDS